MINILLALVFTCSTVVAKLRQACQNIYNYCKSQTGIVHISKSNCSGFDISYLIDELISLA